MTGQFVTVISRKRCTRFGFIIPDLFSEDGRLFLRDMPELSQDVPFPQLKDLPVVATRRGAAGGRSNTLLIYVDEAWNRETADTLASGLQACGRYDAGLSVLVLFREGILDANGPGLVMDIERQMRKLGIPGHVNEDVNGSWAQTLELRAEPGWTIITPEGTAPWKHRGRITSQELTSALNTFLRRSPDVRPLAYRPGIGGSSGRRDCAGSVNIRISGVTLPAVAIGLARCCRDSGHVRSEALRCLGNSSAQAHRSVWQQEDERSSAVVVVIDRAGPREAESLKNELGLDFVVVADPSGKITDRFGVGVWPTTIKLDRRGIVSNVEMGLAGRQRDDSYRTDEEYPHERDAAL